MADVKIERETPSTRFVKTVLFDGLVEIDTSDVCVESIVIDPTEKIALIHYRE
mgnify:CR=1 FL=1